MDESTHRFADGGGNSLALRGHNNGCGWRRWLLSVLFVCNLRGRRGHGGTGRGLLASPGCYCCYRWRRREWDSDYNVMCFGGTNGARVILGDNWRSSGRLCARLCRRGWVGERDGIGVEGRDVVVRVLWMESLKVMCSRCWDLLVNGAPQQAFSFYYVGLRGTLNYIKCVTWHFLMCRHSSTSDSNVPEEGVFVVNRPIYPSFSPFCSSFVIRSTVTWFVEYVFVVLIFFLCLCGGERKRKRNEKQNTFYS